MPGPGPTPEPHRLRTLVRAELRKAGYQLGQRVPKAEFNTMLCRASRRLLEQHTRVRR